MDARLRPFRIDVPDAVLSDLRDRLHRTRWPDPEPVDDWSQGVPLAYLRDVCRTWADDYDWRSRERSLNRFDQFTTTIDDVDIHLIHQRSPEPGALPLLLTHGWPGSIVEFQKVIGPLTAAGPDAFHVVAPSLPGFGFSGKPTAPGWGVDRIADAWAELMTRLGYDRFVAQGGDWGSAVTHALAARHPERCVAAHMTLAMSTGPDGAPTGPDEARALERLAEYRRTDAGYATQQATRPQTLGYGLADSPSGQAAWILEKFRTWTDCGGHPEQVLDRAELLDNVMMYWVTNSAASSARLYWESFGRRSDGPPVTVPVGFTVYPAEIVPPVRRWVERAYPNVRYWAEYERGGHFAAFEVPDTFVADLQACFRPDRQARDSSSGGTSIR